MTLAAAMEHPWLLEYAPVYRFEGHVPVRLVPAEATVNGVPAFGTSSQQSVVADASMLSAAGSQVIFPTSGSGATHAAANATPGNNRSPSRLIQRRGDVMAMARERQFDVGTMPEDVPYSNGLAAVDGAGPSTLPDAEKKRRVPSDEPMGEPMDVSPVKKHRDLEDDSSSSSSSSKKGKTTTKGKSRVSDNTQPRRSGRNARGVAK